MAAQSTTFDSLITDLTRDVHRVQPRDVLQFCANWFQHRLDEQRARIRDLLAQLGQSGLPSIYEFPADFYADTPVHFSSRNSTPTPVSPFSQQQQRRASSFHTTHPNRPFGTLHVPGNALLTVDTNSACAVNPPNFSAFSFESDAHELAPTSPHSGDSNFSSSKPRYSYLWDRRASVSAEHIPLDRVPAVPPPVYPKTEEQLRRIKASIANNFIFRDLDEEQEIGALNAMKEVHVKKDEVVIRQDEVGEYFYVVESGLFYCYIRPVTSSSAGLMGPQEITESEFHPEFGRKVGECRPGNSFGELALMYGEPRAATVQAKEPSTVWRLDRITFRSIILRVAYNRRTLYEHFLSTVPLLSSLSAAERSKIADTLVSSVYMDEEAVVNEGDMGNTFFFVEEGEALVTRKRPSDDGQCREMPVGNLKKGDYFGGKRHAVWAYRPLDDL